MSEPERRLPKSWARYLSDEDNPVTLEEFQAACLSLMLGHIQAMREAVEHTEGIQGAMDDLFAQMFPQQYAKDGKVRAALDVQRNEQRQQAYQKAMEFHKTLEKEA